MDAGDTLSVDVVADGGFAAVACRSRPGLETCDRPSPSSGAEAP
jgi:alpha-glucosidase